MPRIEGIRGRAYGGDMVADPKLGDYILYKLDIRSIGSRVATRETTRNGGIRAAVALL